MNINQPANRAVKKEIENSRLSKKLMLRHCFIIALFFNCYIGVAQQITLQLKNESFKAAIQQIQRQSNYSFVIRDEFFKLSRPVTFEAVNKSIPEILPDLFQDQPFNYQVSGTIITVITKPEAVRPQRQEIITGVVLDSMGKGIAGVSVRAELGVGTVTNERGEFSIRNATENEMLTFTAMGYVPVRQKAIINTKITYFNLLQRNLQK